MKKNILIVVSLFFTSFSVQAEDSQIINPSPEFAEIFKLYEQMTPEQRAEVLASAKKIQAELAAMPIAERQRLYGEAAAAVKTIDFNKVDVSKIDTSRNISVSEVEEMMNNSKKSRAKPASPIAARNPSKPIIE